MKKKPPKACTIHLRIRCDLKRDLKRRAKEEKISLSQAIINIITGLDSNI